MKAAYLEKINQPIQVKEVEKPLPNNGQVLIKIHYAALNHRDVWIWKGQYAGFKNDLILGSDGAGIIEKCGEGIKGFAAGDAVIINPSLNWGDNPNVQGGDFKILGNPDNGTFAEYLTIDAGQVYKKPDYLSFKEAAAIPLAGLTAYRAVFTKGKLKATDTVLITGIGGGTALFALQYCLAVGASVYVTSGLQEKIDQAIALGARGGVLYHENDWHQQLHEQSGGFDLIIDSTAGVGFAHLPEIAKPGATIVNFGQSAGTITELPARYLFWKQLNLLGTTMGNNTDFKAMLEFCEKYQLRPVIDKVFPLSETENAFMHMESKSQFGKIVIAVS